MATIDNRQKAIEVKVVAYFSSLTGKTYKTKAAKKGAETKETNKRYQERVNNLVNKYNN